MAEAKLDLDLQFKNLEAKLAIVEKQIAAGVAQSGQKGATEAAEHIAAGVARGGKKGATGATEHIKDIFGQDTKGDIARGVAAIGAQFTGLAGVGVDAAKSIAFGFAAGGPMALAMAGVQVALGFAAELWKEYGKDAKEAQEKAAKAAKDHTAELEKQRAKTAELLEETRLLDAARAAGTTVPVVSYREALAAHMDAKRQMALARADFQEKERQATIAGHAYAFDAQLQWSAKSLEASRKKEESASAILKSAEARRDSELAHAADAAVARRDQDQQRASDRRRDTRQREAEREIADARRLEEQRVAALVQAHDKAAAEEERFLRAKEARQDRADADARARERAFAAEQARIEQQIHAESTQVQRDAVQKAIDFQEGSNASALALWDAQQEEIQKYAAAVQNVLAPALNAAASAVGQAVGEWARYSRAQDLATEGAAISAEEAEANADAKLQAVLAGIAQESATQAVFEAAKALASLAVMDIPGAGLHAASAVAFAAIAGGTGAAAHGIGESRGETTQERTSREGGAGGGSGGGSRAGGSGRGSGEGAGVTIVINSGGRLYSTQAETEEALREGVRHAESLR